MKSIKKVRRLGNDKGVTVLLVAGIMVTFLLLFAVVGMEFARMYYVRGELQNAADSAALAGADMITDPMDTTQTNARTAAVNFAAKNKTAGQPVSLANDYSNMLSTDNDITVGHWDGTTYSPGFTPVNAVQVRPQRASGLEPARASVDFLFQGIGSLVGWTKMDVRRQAIAFDPPRGSEFIAVCAAACTNGATSCTYPSPPCDLSAAPRVFDTSSSVGPDSSKAAWTSLTSSPTDATGVSALICGNQPYVDVCPGPIYTTNGKVNSTFQDFESLMFDPLFDSENKTCATSDGKCTTGSDAVTSWMLIIPVTTAAYCPPGHTPGTADVFGYAKIWVSAICGSGIGTPCHTLSSAALSTASTACGPYSGGSVVVTKIQCVSCADAYSMLGAKSVMAK